MPDDAAIRCRAYAAKMPMLIAAPMPPYSFDDAIITR